MARCRVPTVFSQNNRKSEKQQKDKNHSSFIAMDLRFVRTFSHSFYDYGRQLPLSNESRVWDASIFFVMTSMISDFSSVLLDIRDSNILYPKPIDKKTISVAKLIHIIIYLSLLTVALVGPSLIAGLIKNGIFFFLVGLMNVVLIDILIVALTALVYLLILKFFDGQKLKDIINYVQIGLSFCDYDRLSAACSSI